MKNAIVAAPSQPMVEAAPLIKSDILSLGESSLNECLIAFFWRLAMKTPFMISIRTKLILTKNWGRVSKYSRIG